MPASSATTTQLKDGKKKKKSKKKKNKKKPSDEDGAWIDEKVNQLKKDHEKASSDVTTGQYGSSMGDEDMNNVDGKKRSLTKRNEEGESGGYLNFGQKLKGFLGWQSSNEDDNSDDEMMSSDGDSSNLSSDDDL